MADSMFPEPTYWFTHVSDSGAELELPVWNVPVLDEVTFSGLGELSIDGVHYDAGDPDEIEQIGLALLAAAEFARTGGA